MDFNKATYLPGGIAGLLGFISAAATIVSKKTHQKESKRKNNHVSSWSRLVSKALQDVSISDAKFTSILNEVEQYYSLKEGLRKNNSRIFLEKVDDATLREEIKKRVSEEIKLSAYTRKELRIQVEGKSNGFSLFIPRHKY